MTHHDSQTDFKHTPSPKVPSNLGGSKITADGNCSHEIKRRLLLGRKVMSNLDQIRSDQISRSVVSNSLPPHESQHARPPCPSPTPRVHWVSCPSSQWCHPAISSSVIPFSSCPQSLPASEYFPMSQLFAWGSQSTGVSASRQTIQYHSNPSLCRNQ